MCACAAFWRIVSKSCDEIRMLNCLFFRIFSSVSFVSLYQTKAQRSGFCLELRSKGAERGMPSPAGRYTRSGLCDEVVGVGFCPIFGIWQDAGTPATSQMRCWLLPNGRIFPAAAGLLCVGSAYCIRIFLRCPHVGATWAFAVLSRTHSQVGQKAAHSGNTRLTARCRCSAHPQGRSCRLFSRAENRHDRHV